MPVPKSIGESQQKVKGKWEITTVVGVYLAGAMSRDVATRQPVARGLLK